MKQAIVVIVLIAAGTWLAHLHVAAQTYYPVVQVLAPEGLTYTAVQDPTGERSACGAANERFLGPLKAQCKQCQILYARCVRSLEGLELAIQEGRSIPHYLVHTPGLRIAIAGPGWIAKPTCDFLATDMVARGVQSATCVYPRPQK
jgi:hypothetical protein